MKFAHLQPEDEAREGHYGRASRPHGTRRAGKSIRRKQRPLACHGSGNRRSWAACLAVGYGYHQQTLVGQLTGQQEQMSATVGQLQGQSNR